MKSIIKGLIPILLTLTIFACSKYELVSDANSVAVFEGKAYTQAQLNEARIHLNKQELAVFLENKLGITSIQSIDATSKLASTMNLKGAITEYIFNNGTSKIYIAQETESSDVYHFCKLNNQAELVSDLTIEVHNNDVVFVGNNTNSTVVFQSKNFTTVDANGWCQQEPQDRGSSSACEGREYDEFTADWVGFIAYWTNPQIALLIALMCTC